MNAERFSPLKAEGAHVSSNGLLGILMGILGLVAFTR